MNNKNNQSEEITWGGLLKELLWICAGANRNVLRQCPTEHGKYSIIGSVILFTAFMSMLSGAYALYIVSDNIWLAMAFGIFWGFLIFKLNHFIVNTMYSDGKSGISWKKFVAGFPRVIIAIILGIVIAIPLELRIFKDEIKVTIEEMKQEELRENKLPEQQALDSEKTYGGLQIHLEAFSKMKKENEFTNVCSLFIMLLFIILDTAPIFFKMMSPTGPYDDLLNAVMPKKIQNSTNNICK